MTDESIRDEVEKNKLKSLSRLLQPWAVWYCYMYVCVWGRKVSIIPINHPLPASVSSWYVGELWEPLITHTHTHKHAMLTHYIITVNSCQAGFASTQITSLSLFFSSEPPPFSPPGPLLQKEPKRIWLNSLVWSPQPHHGVLNSPMLFTPLRWPLTLGDVSERSWGECLSEDGGSGVKDF